MDKTKWTLEWEFKNYKGESIGKRYLVEYWNGGGVKWYTKPYIQFVFDSELKAIEFATKYMWNENDPANNSYKIIPYSGEVIMNPLEFKDEQ